MSNMTRKNKRVAIVGGGLVSIYIYYILVIS